LVVVKRRVLLVSRDGEGSDESSPERKLESGAAPPVGDAVVCTCLDSAAQVLYLSTVRCEVVAVDLRRSEV
jgi:hypothetical protein